MTLEQIKAQQIAGKNLYFCEPEGPQTTVLPRKKTIKNNKLSIDLGLCIFGRFYLEFSGEIQDTSYFLTRQSSEGRSLPRDGRAIFILSLLV